MKIIGLLQNYNGVENGDLARCLGSMFQVSDEIYIYDDASTEDTMSLYHAFGGVVLPGAVNKFGAELFHKRALLIKLLSDHPDCDCHSHSCSDNDDH